HTRFARDWSSDVCSSDLRLQQVTSADLADIALAQCNVLRAEDGVTGEWSGEYHYRLEEVHLGGHKQAPLYLAAVAADPDRDPADGDFRAFELGADRVRRAQRQTQPGVQAVDADLMPGRLAAGGQMMRNPILKVCGGGADKLVDKRIGVQAVTASEGNGYNQPDTRWPKLHIIPPRSCDVCQIAGVPSCLMDASNEHAVSASIKEGVVSWLA